MKTESQSVIVISNTGPKFHPDMIETVFLATKEGRLDDLKVLLDHLPQLEVSRLLLEKDHKFMMTPLEVSCGIGHKEAVEYLLDKCPASIEKTGSIIIKGEKIEGESVLYTVKVIIKLDSIVKTDEGYE